jgi:hypothetical protein
MAKTHNTLSTVARICRFPMATPHRASAVGTRVVRDRTDRRRSVRGACRSRRTRSGSFEARGGCPGRAPARVKQTLNPKHRRDGRRDFSTRAGREALAGGGARGGTHHASAAPEQSRAWQRPRARRGRKQQQTSWTARDVRMATAERSHGQKRETWPPLGFRVFFCVSETCRQSPKHENFFQTGMARSLEKGKKPSAETFAKCSTRVLRSCETFAEWASIPRRAVAVPFPRAKPEGWRRARGEPLRVPVFRRGRVSGARVCSARSRRRRFVASERPHRRGSRSRPLRDDEGARRRGHARGGG